jgi:hypothetical protein
MSAGNRTNDGAHGWPRTPMLGKYFEGISPSALNEEFAGMAVKSRRDELPLLERPTTGEGKREHEASTSKCEDCLRY